ncbi:acyltransferase family protein [Flavobacterium sp.]|uniref:acyltransferase family protein n=1 Tax=Flavobacterium sp. TaxID=239 RepID=UPI003751A7FA
MSNNKHYFPNLNSLRFIAALFVIIHHVEQFKEFLGYQNYSQLPFIKLIGKFGVILFFVLSGYLITYLLLMEQNKNGNISLKQFYIRRILRIWPLYFIIIILAFFITPEINFLKIDGLTEHIHENFLIKIFLYVFFLPNLALALFPIIPFISQLWSVGYEEQFYIIWPILIKKIKNKQLIFLTVILFFIILKILTYFVFKDFLIQMNYFKNVDFFFKMPSINCMAIGAWFAYLLHRKSYLLNFIFDKRTQFLNYLLLSFFVIFGINIPFFNSEFYSLSIAIMLINLSANTNTILNLENRAFNFLGKISYGLYMFHPLMIVIVLKSFNHLNIKNIFLENITSLLLTIIISFFSYNFVEKRFILMKEKFKKN